MQTETCPLGFGSDSALQFLLSMAEPIWGLPRAADGEPGQGSCSRNLLFLPLYLLTSLHSPRDGAGGQGSCWGSAWGFIVKIKLRRALRKAGILSYPYPRLRDTTERALWIKAWGQLHFIILLLREKWQILMRGSNTSQGETQLAASDFFIHRPDLCLKGNELGCRLWFRVYSPFFFGNVNIF